jgi:hypothetical protein
MRNRFFRSGLAGRSGNPYQRFSPQSPHRSSQSLQRREGVFNRDKVRFLLLSNKLVFADNSRDSIAQRLLYKVMAIELFSFDSEEKLVGANSPRIDGIALREGIWVKFTTGSQDFCNARERKFHESLLVVSQS